MPNLLLERIELDKEIIVDFDIAQFIVEEDGDLPEICTQQGIDASAKKSPGRPKGSRNTKSKPSSKESSGTGTKKKAGGKKKPSKKEQAKKTRQAAWRKTQKERKQKKLAKQKRATEIYKKLGLLK